MFWLCPSTKTQLHQTNSSETLQFVSRPEFSIHLEVRTVAKYQVHNLFSKSSSPSSAWPSPQHHPQHTQNASPLYSKLHKSYYEKVLLVVISPQTRGAHAAHPLLQRSTGPRTSARSTLLQSDEYDARQTRPCGLFTRRWCTLSSSHHRSRQTTT